MKKLLFLLFINFLSFKVSALEVILKGDFGYNYGTMKGSEGVPSYSGTGYGVGGELVLFNGWDWFWTIGYEFQFHNVENTASDEDQTEEFDFNQKAFFTQLGPRSLFLRFGYGKLDGVDRASGAVNRDLSLTGTSYTLGLGSTLFRFSSFRVRAQADYIWASFETSENQIGSRLDFAYFKASLALVWIIPSFGFSSH